MRSPYQGLLLALTLGAASAPLAAAEYALDPTHSFVEFRVQHLGYSWLYGRFNSLEGTLQYDAGDPAASRVAVTIDTASIDSNHAERQTPAQRGLPRRRSLPQGHLHQHRLPG
jgi:polyisoprenoid-binding protein YceI